MAAWCRQTPHQTRRPRIAATPEHLRILRVELRRSHLSAQDRAAAWATVLLGFFGAMRGSEYLSPSALTFAPRRTCQWRHLCLRSSHLELTVPASKTDQVYTGSLVSLPRLGGAICPVRAMKRYRRQCRSRPRTQPIFTRSDGRYCRGGWLNGVPRKTSLDSRGRFTTHSLRIGFATAADPDSVIRVSGRWRGSSYLRYVGGSRLSVSEACCAIA